MGSGEWQLVHAVEWAFAIGLAASVIGLIIVGAWSCWRNADKNKRKQKRETAVHDDVIGGPEGKQWAQWL